MKVKITKFPGGIPLQINTVNLKCNKFITKLSLAKELHKCKCCETGLSTLSKKTRMSNRLQMSLQRQHFLLSYFKTLSVGPAGV